jgi:integrase
MPRQYRPLVLVGAYAGLRWGEAAGLRRRDIDPLRSRISVVHTAVEVRGQVSLDNGPKTTRSKRSIPVARTIIRRLEQHLVEFVDGNADALVFTAPRGGPLFRSWGRTVLRPASIRANLDEITFHVLRHSFVAIIVAAGCNVREVSEWAGHNSVAFTLTRYGGLFEDGADAAVDRLDALLVGKVTGGSTIHLLTTQGQGKPDQGRSTGFASKRRMWQESLCSWSTHAAGCELVIPSRRRLASRWARAARRGPVRAT